MHKSHVLVLEDDVLLAIDLQDALEDGGFQTSALFDCEEADEWLRENTPDVAILDIVLDGQTCVDLAKTLVERRVPFLVHTERAKGGAGLDPVFRSVPWLKKTGDYRETVRCLHELLRSSPGQARG